MKKRLSIILIILILIQLIIPYSGVLATQIINDANNWFIQAQSQGEKFMNPDTVAKDLEPISRILFWAGIVTLNICFVVMGIQYITGNPEEQAKKKTQLIGLVVSTVVILGAYTIWKWTYLFMKKII